MFDRIDLRLLWLIGGAACVLVVASVIGAILARRATTPGARATVINLNARIRAWWVMCALLAGISIVPNEGAILLFGLTSFLALREFVTLAPTSPADHSTLSWSFYLVVPLQYLLVWTNWYGMLSIFIPVYVFLLVPTVSVLAGDTEQFLTRTATIQWALMVCVYCVSYIPGLLYLDLRDYSGSNVTLLLFLVIVVQGSDVLQYIWGKSIGRRSIAPKISPNKTWEGFLGGVTCATLLGAALWWATPFAPWQAGLMALVLALMGFAGGLTMSAIKRDRGVKDFGTVIAGHGGVLDRIDSLCFAAPIFFHLTRYFFT